MKRLLKPSLDWFLIFLPGAVIADYMEAAPTLVFFLACLAILPLAGWMGKATEHIAAHTGEGVGGLLNATFGNAAELIIAIVALRNGLIDVVKASLTGSIIGNILLVLGRIRAGRRPQASSSKRFNAAGARMQATLLTLAAVGLIAPAAFHHLAGPADVRDERDLSFEIAIVLLSPTALTCSFPLHTHKELFRPAEADPRPTAEQPVDASRKALVLSSLGATALVAWVSEILVGSVEQAAHALRDDQRLRRRHRRRDRRQRRRALDRRPHGAPEPAWTGLPSPSARASRSRSSSRRCWCSRAT